MSTRSEPQADLVAQLAPFEVRKTPKAAMVWILTFVPFVILVEILTRLIQAPVSMPLLALVYFLATLFQARLFVLMHDCGHNRLTGSNFLNNWIGHLCAFSFAVPFLYWRDLHNQHHKYQGNLDQRDQHIDLWTLTVKEYENSSKLRKAIYRFYRAPFSLFLIGPSLFFLFFLRWPLKRKSRAAIKNILILDFILFSLIGGSFFHEPLRMRLITLVSIAAFNFSLALWLFYQQHVFTDSYWTRDSQFDNKDVSISGSSFIVFPRYLNWFAASIGYHHIHHLNTKIPYYNLRFAHSHLKTKGLLLSEKALKPVEMLRNTKLKLWCENTRRMVGFLS